MSAFLIKTNNTTDIIFHFNTELIQVIKQVEGVKFDNYKKRWTMPTFNFQKLTEKLHKNNIPYIVDDNTTDLPKRAVFGDKTNISDNSTNTIKVIQEDDSIRIKLPIALASFNLIKQVEHTRDYNKKEMIKTDINSFKKVCIDNEIKTSQS
mgnify:CR=1 FL=1